MTDTPASLSGRHFSLARPFSFPLAFATVLLILFPLASLSIYSNFARPYQGNFNEGWNAYHARLAFSPRQLYPDDFTWSITNYPPGSFLTVAALAAPLGHGHELLIGKLLSLAGLFLLGLAAWNLLRTQLAPSNALFGALFIAVFYVLVFPVYVAANDPQLLALGLGLLAFSLAVDSTGASVDRRTVGAASIFALALFVKHNVIGLPLAALLHLFLNNRKLAARLLLYLAAFGVFSALAYQLIYGSNFWIHLLAKRSYSLAQAKTIWKDLLGQASLPFAIAFLYLVCRPISRETAWLPLALCLSGCLALGFSGGGGVGTNMFFDALFFALLACMLFFAKIAAPAPGTLSLAVMPIVLLLQVSPELVNRILTFSPGQLAHSASKYRAEVAYLRDRPGPAICDNLLLCFNAGKPLALDLYWTSESILTRRLSASEYIRRIDSRDFPTIQLELPPSVDATQPFSHIRLQSEVVEAILRNYTLDRRTDFQAVFIAKDRP